MDRPLPTIEVLCARLRPLFGDPDVRLVVLFGSLQIEGNDPGGESKEAARRIACDLSLEHALLVSVFVANREFLDTHSSFSFVRAVKQEGVVV
jgi:hypothetical protein